MSAGRSFGCAGLFTFAFRSHATYYAIAAGASSGYDSNMCFTNSGFLQGCYLSMGNKVKAKELFDKIPALFEGRKIGGKDLPTEVLLRKKRELSTARPRKSRVHV